MRHRVLILGGGSQLTPLLVEALGSECEIVVTTTSPSGCWDSAGNVSELSYPRDEPHQLGDRLTGLWEYIISLVPITVLPRVLPALDASEVGRFIALSTASVQTKRHTRSTAEATFLAAVKRGEEAFLDFTGRRAIPAVLLRPAMTYGGTDNNVGFIRRMGRSFGFFPVVSRSGLRQPVHVHDVVAAIMAALTSTSAPGQTYFLAGGEQLTFEQMARRVMRNEIGHERVFAVPAPLLILVLRALSMLPRFRYLDTDMVRRMREDHVFDNEPAKRDLAFDPRGFDPGCTPGCHR